MEYFAVQEVMFIHPDSTIVKTNTHLCKSHDKNNYNEDYKDVYNKNDLTIIKEDGILTIFFELPSYQCQIFQLWWNFNAKVWFIVMR